MFQFPLLLTIYAGFTHAFETDHLLAVSNIVSQRNNTFKSLKDGIFWGLGHTSTILFIGFIMLLLKVQINPAYFQYLEVSVGLMLIGLGICRLCKLKKFLTGKNIVSPPHPHPHSMLAATDTGVKKLHLISYGVGLVHGVAGSGELVLLVMLQMASPQSGLLYLLIFGVGSIFGMLAAAAMFSIPFSKKLLQARVLQVTLILMSSILCIGFGTNIVYKNLCV